MEISKKMYAPYQRSICPLLVEKRTCQIMGRRRAWCSAKVDAFHESYHRTRYFVEPCSIREVCVVIVLPHSLFDRHTLLVKQTCFCNLPLWGGWKRSRNDKPLMSCVICCDQIEMQTVCRHVKRACLITIPAFMNRICWCTPLIRTHNG